MSSTLPRLLLTAVLIYSVGCFFPTRSSRVSSLEPDFPLRIVRDSISGLLHRTVERSVVIQGGTAVVKPLNVTNRLIGADWPLFGLTMMGEARLQNIEFSLRTVISQSIPGDFIECGVWRGGGSLYAAFVLRYLGEPTRLVWLADSFQGAPAARLVEDSEDWYSGSVEYLKVSVEEVKENLRAYGLLDSRIQFCEGYFSQSLPVCPVQQIAVLRVAGKMYESTMDQLFNLYSKVSVGGFVIIDDWSKPPCKLAVTRFRKWHNLTESLNPIDKHAVYWRKVRSIEVQQWRYLELRRASGLPHKHGSAMLT